ncbi:hypothetical protein [uncultured Pseudacidovorax sp.]|uniref:hypothetical protein n=1 Tax=uncultured Pseudacidovorax sp. TaxID=679313 RepID=UPI0025E7B1EC|nr:hypothetical protein [uncultured Pseudacidovorax sp.]
MSLSALRRTDAAPSLPQPQGGRALSQTALRVIGVTAVAWGVRLGNARPARATAPRPTGPLRALQRLRVGGASLPRPPALPATALAHSW